MSMIGKEILSIVLISVVLVLLLKNASNTTQVMNSLGSVSTGFLAQLQGGGTGGSNQSVVQTYSGQ